eukprot:157133_1
MSPSVYIIWMIVFAYSMEQSLSTWSFSGSGGPSGVIQYSIDVQETVTYMRIGSGIDNWFSIGFGGSTMTNIYMLVFGYETSSDSVPVTMDFYSSGHSEGTQQKECSSSTCSTLLGYSFANGRADINVSIPHNSAYSKTFNFGDTLTASYQLDLIFAIGRQSSLVYPGSTGHAAGGWTTASHINAVTNDAEYKELSKTQIGAGSGIYLELKLYQSTSTMVWTMYGPSTQWFAIGWGPHTNADALVYCTDGSTVAAYDYHLQGTSLVGVTEDTQSWNILSDSIVSNERVINATRSFDTGDASDLVFDMTVDSMQFRAATRSGAGGGKPGSEFEIANHQQNRWLETVTFESPGFSATPTRDPITANPSSTPTAQPTNYIAPNVTIKTFPKSTLGTDIALQMKKYESTGIFEVELYGPIGSWFGVAFGSHTAGNALIYSTDFDGLDTAGVNVDWSLKGQTEALVMKDTEQNWNVTEIAQVNGQQKIIAQRAFATSDPSDRTLKYDPNDITVLVARSASNSLQMAYHGVGNAWEHVITFQAGEDVTSAPTISPGSAAPTTAQPTTFIAPNITTKTYPKTTVGQDILLAMKKYETTAILEVELHGPIGSWFGVAFGSHFESNALIYTTGHDGLATAGQKPDWVLDGQDESNVFEDTTQDWNVTDISAVNGLQRMVATRALNDYASNSMTVLVAKSADNSLQMADHGANKWKRVIVFEAGENVTSAPTAKPITAAPTTAQPTTYIATDVTSKTLPKTEISGGSGMFIALAMDQNTEILEVELYGPIGKWFGVAFGAHTDGDALIYTTGFGGADTAGEEPDYTLSGKIENRISKDEQQDWTVTEVSQVDGVQKIAAFKALDEYNQYSVNTINILVAHGKQNTLKIMGITTSTLQFAYHGTWCWATTLDFESGTSSVTTTALTTTDEDDQSDDDEVDEMVFELTEIADSDGIFIGASMRKSTATYTLTLHGPSDGWFGVLWEDHYAGDAFIWLNDGEPDYRASGKEVEHIVKDTIQSWTIVESVEEDGMIEIVATRALDSEDAEHDYPFDYDKKKQYILVARSADHSYDLADHGVNRWSTVLDFESGELQLTDSSSSVFWTINHAVFMLLGFGFMIPCAVALFRYQLVFAKWMSSYFMIIPIGESALVLGTVAGLIGLLEKIAEIYPDAADHTFSYHSYGGFALITLWILFMLMYYICTTKRAVSKKDTWFNLVVSIAIVCMSFAQILSGIVFSQTPTAYAVAFCVYAAIYGTMFIVLQIYWTKTQDGLEQVGSSRMMLMQIVNGETKDDNLNKL